MWQPLGNVAPAMCLIVKLFLGSPRPPCQLVWHRGHDPLSGCSCSQPLDAQDVPELPYRLVRPLLCLVVQLGQQWSEAPAARQRFRALEARNP
jgi:hypothetical protein